MDAFRTADYRAPDGPFVTNMNLTFATTAQISALVTAKQIGIGTIYFDTTISLFKIGFNAGSLPAGIQIQNNAATFTTLATTALATLASLTVTGQSTLAAARVTALQHVSTDYSGTPGNVATAAVRGKAAFAAASSSVVLSIPSATAGSMAIVQLNNADATLMDVVAVCSAGAVTVTGNGAATGIVTFDYLLIVA